MDAIQATFAFFESLLKNRSPPKHFSFLWFLFHRFFFFASYYSLLIKYCENRWNRWFDLNFVEEHVKINIFSKTNHNEDNSMRKKFVFFKLLHIFFQYFKFNSINYHIIERGLPLFSIKIIIQWIKNWIEFVSKCLIIPLFRLFFFFSPFVQFLSWVWRTGEWMRVENARLVTPLKHVCAHRGNETIQFYYFASLQQEVITECRFAVGTRAAGQFSGDRKRVLSRASSSSSSTFSSQEENTFRRVDPAPS